MFDYTFIDSVCLVRSELYLCNNHNNIILTHFVYFCHISFYSSVVRANITI